MKRPIWMENPPKDFDSIVELLRRKRNYLKSPGSKGKFLRQLLKEARRLTRQAIDEVKKLQPLQFFKPSYEQSLILNSWIYGIQFNAVYSANRIGKTAACIVNILLWLFPNNPEWEVFKPYTDHLGRYVHVLRRPNISSISKLSHLRDHLPLSVKQPNPRKDIADKANAEYLQLLQTPENCHLIKPAYPAAPWDTGGTIWFGAPDHDHHQKILFPMWQALIPARSLDRYSPSQKEISIRIQDPNGKVTAWELAGKSYESEDTKWSSGAVDIIMLTEGITPAILKEVKLRFKTPGIGSHDFTPYLPSNAGAASALAKRIAEGKEPLPLRSFAFTKFRVYDAPVYIMSDEKRKGLIKSYENDPEGKARLEGQFYSSSGLILSKLNRAFHLLPFSLEECRLRWPTARFIRGLDPGIDHPTACAWGLLLPTNQIIIYRIFSQKNLSISERCTTIIRASGNTRAKVRWGPGPRDFYYREVYSLPTSEPILKTYTDFHEFKRDPRTKKSNHLNYKIEGLRLSESVHMSPEDRAMHLDDALKIKDEWIDLRTMRPGGPRLYFLQYGPGILEAIEKWEELYWDRVKTGEWKGMPKDKVPEHGDDELDAVSYVECAPIRWTSEAPSDTLGADEDLDTELIELAREHLQTPAPEREAERQNRFATIANHPAREVVIFGAPLGTIDNED